MAASMDASVRELSGCLPAAFGGCVEWQRQWMRLCESCLGVPCCIWRLCRVAASMDASVRELSGCPLLHLAAV